MKVLASTLAVLAGLAAGQLAAQPLDTAFTYQGRLQDAGAPANGPYDFRFILYDAAVGGSQVGPIVTKDDVVVASGLFTVSLDFGTSAFTGNKRWLDIGIRPGASGGAYTALSERQELQSAPHSVFSQRSPWAGIAGKPAGFADDTDNDALGGLTCASGQLAKWNGTAWACAADVDTTYSAGAGLDLTGTAFSLADLGVTTPKLANLAVSTAKLADGAVTSAKIADATVATADLASGAVTSSVIADGTVALADLGQNGCGPNQILKWNGTAWACANDLDTNSGGTVTSVATGAGLTGGPITTTGTVSVATGGIATGMLADGAVTSPKIASGAVGLSQINTAEVQARVGTTCPPGQYLRGINPDGTVVCEPFFAPNLATTVAGPGGRTTSIKMGADGLPIISHFDGRALYVAHCGNAACSVGNRLTVVDDPPAGVFVGQYSSIAIGAGGGPVISYYDLTSKALRVAHCEFPDCSPTGSNTVFIVNDHPAFVWGQYTSIAIGTDGLPVISHHDASNGTLKVTHCGSLICVPGGNTLSTVDDPDNFVGAFTSIAIGADGFPVISYQDVTAGALMVAHCGNVACTAGNTISIVDDPANFVGGHTSIAIGTDGLPVISYLDATAGALMVAHCGDAACTPGGNTISIVDPSANLVGYYTSIAIGTDGLPVISYLDESARDLKVAHCGNTACTAGNTVTPVDSADLVGFYTSIAIGTDGLPVISYQDSRAEALKVAKCATRTCQ